MTVVPSVYIVFLLWQHSLLHKILGDISIRFSVLSLHYVGNMHWIVGLFHNHCNCSGSRWRMINTVIKRVTTNLKSCPVYLEVDWQAFGDQPLDHFITMIRLSSKILLPYNIYRSHPKLDSKSNLKLTNQYFIYINKDLACRSVLTLIFCHPLFILGAIWLGNSKRK